MVCPRCGSTNTHTEISREIFQYRKGHSCLWWIFIGWWWRLIWFLIFNIWYVIYRLIVNLTPNSSHVKERITHICNNCGNVWH